jgi:hypothetical protein
VIISAGAPDMAGPPALPGPKPSLGWVHQAATILSWLVILGMIGFVAAPLFTAPTYGGGHDWEQMESHRYLVTKTILRFHQFPFWNPYSCGGHTSWGGFESGVTVVSPWLPFYLSMSLAHAMRVEILGSALISAIGAWLLAGRFTRSPAVRCLVVIAFVVNARWALQLAVGHSWHLVYAWTPWTFYFFDRAVGADPMQGRARMRDVVLTGACFAIMFYMGGIYPLPQTIVLVGLYGCFLAVVMRSLRPILVGVAAGLIGFGLAAPKLLPLVDLLRQHPRLIVSTETLDLAAFLQILTSRDQDLSSHPGIVSQWGWHEWGMYVGWAVVIVVTMGCLLGRGVRESPLKWAGVAALLLGFGAFDPHAPWTLLHTLPVFKSQHVPSRWQYPGLLLLLVVATAALERILRRSGAARGWLEVALLGGVAWMAYDIGTVAYAPMTHVFTNPMPVVQESTGPFHTEIHIPPELSYSAGWEPPSLPAEMANIGTIDCGTSPALHNFIRDQNGRAPGLGAHGRGDPAYRGETFIAEGVGTATIVSWTPNVVTVHVTGAREGGHVVLNQNWDAGWRANGRESINWEDTVAAPLHGPDETIVFRYRPRFWNVALFLFAMTVGVIGCTHWLTRQARLARLIARIESHHRRAESFEPGHTTTDVE